MRCNELIKALFVFAIYFGTFNLFAQEGKKKIGKAISSKLDVLSGEVINLRTQRKTYIGNSGYFEFFAKPKDTLMIKSLGFEDLKVCVFKEDLDSPTFIIQLVPLSNMLNEVKVFNGFNFKGMDAREAIRGSLSTANRATTTSVMPSNGETYGINFIEVGKLVVRWFKKKKKVEPSTTERIAIINKFFGDNFLAKEFQMNNEDVLAFVEFCAKDVRFSELLDSKSKLALYELLLEKKLVYQKENQKASEK